MYPREVRKLLRCLFYLLHAPTHGRPKQRNAFDCVGDMANPFEKFTGKQAHQRLIPDQQEAECGHCVTSPQTMSTCAMLFFITESCHAALSAARATPVGFDHRNEFTIGPFVG